MKPTDFSVHVTTFLTHYLAAQRNVSPNTIKAYRDVFTLLLRFCRDVQKIAPERLRLEQIGVPPGGGVSGLLRTGKTFLAPDAKPPPCCPSRIFSDTFRPRIPNAWFSVNRFWRFPFGNTHAIPLSTFPKNTWRKFWRSLF